MHARLSRRIKRWSLPLYDASSQGSLNQCLLQKLTGLRAQTITFVPVMMVMCESRHHSLNLRAFSDPPCWPQPSSSITKGHIHHSHCSTRNHGLQVRESIEDVWTGFWIVYGNPQFECNADSFWIWGGLSKDSLASFGASEIHPVSEINC